MSRLDPTNKTLALRYPKRREDLPEDKPLNLRAILANYHIKQSEWANNVLQTAGQGTGRGLSQPAATLILKHNEWPRLTSPDSIMGQTEKFLREYGVSEEEIAIAWDYEDSNSTVAIPTNAETKNKAKTIKANDYLTDLPENQMLSQKAKKHFHIFKDPFIDDVTEPDDVFLSSEQLYIRESMYHVAKHAGFLAVVGESGAGKSTLRRDLLDRIKRGNEPITVIQANIIDKERLTAGSLCEAIINDISNEAPKQSLEAKARQITKLLTGSSRAGNSHVLIIEEAHDITITVLKYLKRFWELEDGFKKLLAIILIGQPELKTMLDVRANWDAREVINRCEVAELLPLNGDMEKYLALKFERVGAKLSDIFEDDAFGAIRERLTYKQRGSQTQMISMHYPLIVNNTVIVAMNLAADMGAKKINAEIIKGV